MCFSIAVIFHSEWLKDIFENVFDSVVFHTWQDSPPKVNLFFLEVSSHQTSDEIDQYIQYHGLTSVILLTEDKLQLTNFFLQNHNFTGFIRIGSLKKILKQILFIIQNIQYSYFFFHETQEIEILKKITIQHTSEKNKILEELQGFLKKFFITRSQSAIINAADEILMNAIFDAPQVGTTQLLRYVPRFAQFQLEKSIEVQYGFFKGYFLFQVQDLYGNLDCAHLKKCLFQEFSKKEYSISEEQNASLGLMNVLHHGGSLWVQMVPQKKTLFSLFYTISESHLSLKESCSFFISQIFNPK